MPFSRHISSNPKLYAHPMNLCYGVFVNFWVIFGYIWEETVFLKVVVKFREIRNIEDFKSECSFKIRI